MNRSATDHTIVSAWNDDWGAVGALSVTEWPDSTLLVAGAAGGVFASDDSGDTWLPLGSGGLQAVTTLATSGSLYAGGMHGLARLDAGGDDWTPLLGSQVHAVLAFTGEEGDLVIAGTELDGIVRSVDGGRSWVSATAGLLDTTVLALATSPPGARDRVLLAGTESGIYFSRNDGKAWRFASLPFDDVAVQCLAVAADWSNDRLAFAGTEEAGLLRSGDGGVTWSSVPHFGAYGITAIAVAPSMIATASGREIATSVDGGESWRDLATANEDVWSLWFTNIGDRTVLLAGLARGGIQRFEVV